MEKKTYMIALAGNPNSGKTTVFNHLAGAREKVGNWPGTTVERKEGFLRTGEKEITIVDLPGIYSLSAYSHDERITRDFIVKEKPDLVVVIIDASNLERNLYLPVQLLEMGQNIVIDLNMMDVVRENGVEIDSALLSQILRTPVVTTVAAQEKGLTELRAAIDANLERRAEALHLDYGSVEETLHALEEHLKSAGITDPLSPRALSVKIIEKDEIVSRRLSSQPGFEAAADFVARAASQIAGEDTESYMVERRYAFLRGLVRECAKRHMTFDARLTFSDKLDRVLTDRFLGIPIFLAMMFFLFALVFLAGNPVADMMDSFFQLLSHGAGRLMLSLGFPGAASSLVSDGIIPGVGSVLVFLPYIVFLFFGISVMEDSGYLARGAFIMDRMMHSLGLHGKSFIPMLLGFGCSIPGIMSARTLDSEKDRILTVLVLPLMSCSARLPVYTLFAAALFPGHQSLIVFSLYLLGVVLAVLMARIFKSLLFREEAAPLVMELPPYRMPNWKNTFFHMWLRALLFVKKAGTIIFAAVVIVWVLASVPAGVEYASEKSAIGLIGKTLAPLFRPAGFGDWKAAVALLTGIVAKENVVGTLGTLYGVEETGLLSVLQQHFTPLSGYAFLVMILVYVPCIATVATIKNELNWKWAAVSVVYSLLLGWTLSVAIYQLGRLVVG